MDRTIRSQFNFIIPKKEFSHEILKRVDSATIAEAESRGINGLVSWMPTTATVVFVNTVIRLLKLTMDTKDNKTVNVMDLLEVTAKTRRNKDAEKEGNINISFHIGKSITKAAEAADSLDEIVNLLSKEFTYISELVKKNINDLDGSEWEEVKFLKTIDESCQKEVYEKYGFVLGHDWTVSIIAFIYLKHIYMELLNELITTQENAVSLNFMEITDFHVVYKNDSLEIRFSSDYNSKMGIKNDDYTEKLD